MQPRMDGGNDVRIETLTGPAILPLIPHLQRLRAAVFREWPYLYEGDPAVESSHLRAFAHSPGAAIVVALRDGAPVGASTCLPLADESANVRAPFETRGLDPARFFYFGESVLVPDLRGRGIGVAFFREREAHAKRVSRADYACFCAVERPANHPLRPPGAAGLAPFWTKRGYTHYPDLACTMTWPEVGGTGPVQHRLSFWIKPLHGAPLP